MKGGVATCDITSNYNYNTFVSQLEQKYGFEQIGEGGFGVILGVKQCVVKLVKDIKRCKELKNEIAFYNRIESKQRTDLWGRVPKFSIYEELNEYCHFNIERIYSPLLEYDDGKKERVGYLIGDEFKFLKTKYPNEIVDVNNLFYMPRRKIIHFYINHYDLNFKYKSDDKGDMYGLNILVNTFGDYVKELTFAMGQLLSFLILDCKILPFDIEVAAGCGKDKISKIYMFDFNECIFADNMSLDLMAKEAARSMYAKDGKHYFPNDKNLYYEDFKLGMLYECNKEESEFIEVILDYYNQF